MKSANGIFEVWNEPNLSGFWRGSQAAYFQLYDASAKALKRVDGKLRVGGPATSRASWDLGFHKSLPGKQGPG